MKSTLIAAALFLLVGCQRNQHDDRTTVTGETEQPVNNQDITGRAPAVCNPDLYEVILESRTQVGSNWEWVWSIRNTNPGNGSNGTAQDLSNWGMPLSACVPFSAIVGAGYSYDGVSYTSFTPAYGINPSQNCMTVPVVKFDVGTNGGDRTFYKLIVNQDYPPAWVPGYFKSGSNTGCCLFNFDGIGCYGGGGTEE